ncbi:FUSC family protein [Riemerella anatipestifer]|uniref:Inner membrane protein YccS n=1 Tax=Riemerella anatipestifer TaxID=34085 RepID=A0A1S7DQ49_RIEAN|nr:FUSC family membrane protein [Riemerella anatipestifer]AQY21238.1 Inner membrane protein YccS [Riemerella anatipestifer]MCO4304538.1 FUSC family protein [Riemerella anatipestifer]MCO7353312.1 FUSC family protein [Riemerella anatipestifer]MCQ4040201.1 FUSC family protein [Riemerella anatipestifer]MCT6761512.1 FUSC family protein [Riemerella anatipestifer]
MKYTTELKNFFSSQYLYAGVRISLAIVIPSIIFSYLGVFKDFFLFPLGTSFIALVDLPGSFVRRRNTLIAAIIAVLVVSTTASLLKDYSLLVFLEIIIFGMFFNMIGVYGARLASVGGLSLVVLAIFIDGHLTGNHIIKSLFIFTLGTLWYLLLLLLLSRLQPYKLAKQLVGENYLELAKFLEQKSKFYSKDSDLDQLVTQLTTQQIFIKNIQEETRELLFKTRKFVNESTTASRLLMMNFISSIDLYEKLLTSDNDYSKIRQFFGNEEVFNKIQRMLFILSIELKNIGISIQTSSTPKPKHALTLELEDCFNIYFDLRNQKLSAETLDYFLLLRQSMMRLAELTESINQIYKVSSQDTKLAKSLSSGLDLSKFLPDENPINFKVFKNNLSLDSAQFRYSIRVTIAMLIGYAVSKIDALSIGHSYWILITIVAIMRPAYSITKSRNLLRLYGTLVGAFLGTAAIYWVTHPVAQVSVLFISMVFCFATFRTRYFWAVLFMTIYIFLAFNFLNPGHFEVILKDRIIDTIIAGIIALFTSYFIFPVWEHTQNQTLMLNAINHNKAYFEEIIKTLQHKNITDEKYRLLRKNATIALANLSDNFQRMLSDPKNQQKKLEHIHQFVNTSHLLTAYIASLSQYAKTTKDYPEIDFEAWDTKINAELSKIKIALNNEFYDETLDEQSQLTPEDYVHQLLNKRKTEISENEFYNTRDSKKVTYLTELKSIQELLELIFSTAKKQRKVSLELRKYYISSTTAK